MTSKRFILLILPVPLVLLAVYVLLQGQIKLPGLVILALFLVLLECVAAFLYRCFATLRRRNRR